MTRFWLQGIGYGIVVGFGLFFSFFTSLIVFIDYRCGCFALTIARCPWSFLGSASPLSRPAPHRCLAGSPWSAAAAAVECNLVPVPVKCTGPMLHGASVQGDFLVTTGLAAPAPPASSSTAPAAPSKPVSSPSTSCPTGPGPPRSCSPPTSHGSMACQAPFGAVHNSPEHLAPCARCASCDAHLIPQHTLYTRMPQILTHSDLCCFMKTTEWAVHPAGMRQALPSRSFCSVSWRLRSSAKRPRLTPSLSASCTTSHLHLTSAIYPCAANSCLPTRWIRIVKCHSALALNLAVSLVMQDRARSMGHRSTHCVFVLLLPDQHHCDRRGCWAAAAAAQNQCPLSSSFLQY
jgi:hypothetical protein